MLDGRSQDSVCAAAGSLRHGGAPQGEIVTFRAATGEDDLCGATAQDARHGFPGVFDGGFGLLAPKVDGRWITEGLCEIGEHDVEHARVDGGCGRVVEIDA